VPYPASRQVTANKFPDYLFSDIVVSTRVLGGSNSTKITSGGSLQRYPRPLAGGEGAM